MTVACRKEDTQCIKHCNVKAIIGVKENPCHKLQDMRNETEYERHASKNDCVCVCVCACMRVCGLSWHSQSHDQHHGVFWKWSKCQRKLSEWNMREQKWLEVEKQWDWEVFKSANSSSSVWLKGQHNAGSSFGNQPDSLTFAKWELIHFVKVLFCTASCSSVNQSPEYCYQSHAIINKEGIKTQSSHCLLFWMGLQSWMVTAINFDIITFCLMCLKRVTPNHTLHWCSERRHLTFKDGI